MQSKLLMLPNIGRVRGCRAASGQLAVVLSCRCSVRLTCYGGMCIAQVNVQRYGPLPFNGYDWTITFVSNPGALVLLVAIASWLMRVLTVLLSVVRTRAIVCLASVCR